MSTVKITFKGKVVIDAQQRTWFKSMDAENCQACSTQLEQTFYDMKTKKQGAWGILCRRCAYDGVGVGRCGIGYGQQYQRQPNGSWVTWIVN